jgi:monoamine oxidase
VSPLAPGVLKSFGPALREPDGRLHWAGTETADVWNGYMDGAVRSGKRAAREVVESLAATRA